jgi:cytochrome o ubiquinol oxidase operon protein cyoD
MSGMRSKTNDDYAERYTSYSLGFLLSVAFTLIAFALVITDVLPSTFTIAIIVLLAIAQLFVQLLFFLHLGEESKPRMSSQAFAFMGIIVFILVAGTLWIMANLDYTTMPKTTESEIIKDEGYSLPVEKGE